MPQRARHYLPNDRFLKRKAASARRRIALCLLP